MIPWDTFLHQDARSLLPQGGGGGASVTIPDFILGVDPGLGGALALYDWREPHRSKLIDMPVESGKLDAPRLASEVKWAMNDINWVPVIGVIENVHSRPRQAGAFNFGLSTGIVHGVLAANGIPFVLVAPQVWKVKMGLQRSPDEPASATKDRARALASKLFPNLADQFKRKKDDGRAEALLLAVYYHHTLTGGK